MYKAIIFDVGDTLLEYHSSQTLIYISRIESMRFVVDFEMTFKSL
ncbi:hypothetical protein FACS1894219_12960 [Clostridia bacterium]|nr:hypothetical protein FACS1894219_12960 [Clostridia bacterium]